jgi:Protein of unknown function (DUF3455)
MKSAGYVGVGLVVVMCGAGRSAASLQQSGAPAAAAPHEPIRRPTMPIAALEPPSSLVPVLQSFAQGVQRYICQAVEGKPDQFAWTLKEPDAKLFDETGKEIGRHFAGPAWELSDGSKVVKTKVAGSMPALAFDAVPWLLVAVSSSGSGTLSGVQYVQRIDTVGGVAPTTGCDAAHKGTTEDVGYRATYLFYAPPR